jgi:hypothetical protein
MSWIQSACFLFTIFMVGNFNGQSAPEAAGNSGITIRFFNYAHVPAKILNSAKDRITAIYQITGIGMNWIECPVGDQDPSAYAACTEVWDATHLFLHLLPKATKTTKVEKVGESLLGARMAKIYWDRVREQAVRLQVEPEWILAYVIAHEVGHLLLGSNSHSPTGIMAGKWGREEIINISQFGLNFASQQAELIRAELQRRMLSAKETKSPSNDGEES